MLGPLLGLLLLHVLDGQIRVALALAVVPAVISVALVGLVHESEQQRHRVVSVGVRSRELPPGMWRILAPLTVFGLVNSTDALLLQHAGDVGLSTTRVVAAYVCFNVVYATLGYPAGRLADRLAPRLIFAVGLVVFAVVYMGLGFAGSSGAVWLLLPLYGAFPALTDGIARAWLADLAPSASRTWVLGVHGATTGLAVLGAGVWSGLLRGDAGRVPLVVSGIVATFVAVWLVADRRTDRALLDRRPRERRVHRRPPGSPVRNLPFST